MIVLTSKKYCISIASLLCTIMYLSTSLHAQREAYEYGLVLEHRSSTELSYIHSIQVHGESRIGSSLQDKQKQPSAALRRSLLLPGWGEFYANPQSWSRGQWHMAADISMVLSYLGIRYRSVQLDDELITFARSRAGIDLSGRDRELYLAVSNHNSLDLYNDYLLRTRNWNKLVEESPNNQWSWEATSDRSEFNRMRERIDKSKNQLPALVTLMVVNRVISGIHAFGLVRDELTGYETEGVKLMTKLDLLQPEWSNESYLGAQIRLNF